MTDQDYRIFDYELRDRGIVARYLTDDLPPQTYLNLDSWESREENSIASRFGPMMITTNGTNNTPLTDTNVHTLRRLKGIGQTWRYAGAGANLYRRTGDTNGAYAQINGVALSGSRFSADVYRLNFSSSPYLLIADSAQMLKDNGTGNAQKWGGLAPTIPPTIAIAATQITSIATGSAVVIGSFSAVNIGGFANASRVNTTLGTAVNAAGIATVSPASMTNIVPGMFLQVDTAAQAETVYVMSVTATSFTANFTKTHLATAAVVNGNVTGTVAANTTGQIQIALAAGTLTNVGNVAAVDDDLISLYVFIDNPANVQQIQVMFDVSDGSFTKSYYMKTVTPDTLQALVSGNQTGAQAVTQRVFARAGGQVDTRRSGHTHLSILPIDDPGASDAQPDVLDLGLSQWTWLQIKRGDFLPVGQAGNPGFDWSAVTKAQVTFQAIATAGITVGLDDWAMVGGSGLDSFGGIAYDYRYTYFNINTGFEANPSITLIPSLGLLPRRQPITVTWTPPTDAQFTHVRIYRRGGSLSVGWTMVTQIAVGTNTFTDTLADSVIVTNKSLELDNDAPVTSTLPVPVNTNLGTAVTAGSTQTVTPGSLTNIFANQLITIGIGAKQEQVYVQSINAIAGTFTAFFQNAHGNTETVSASTRPNTPMNLMAIGFDRAWVAGDLNNPHILYYSKKFNPESFPPQNALEIGKPDDPIMGIVSDYRGLVYVFTLSKIYSVFAPGGSTPQVYPTAETEYGLVANFGFTVGNGAIRYQSKDGIRSFRGGASELMTLNQDWLFTGQTFGPIVPADKTKFDQTLLAYHNRQMYVSYIDINGTRRRLIWNDSYQRFRNDSVACNSLFVEKDKNFLLFSDTNGNIFQDRVNNFDDGGFSAGVQIKNAIPLNFQSGYMDQGQPKFQKNYNEFTLKIDTQGETVTLQLLFDYGAGPTLTLSSAINTTGLTSLQFQINSGNGQLAYNVSVKITGNVRNVVTLKEFAFKAAFETDKRQSFDTYWRDSGSPEYKLIKQGWFHYTAADPAGVTVNIYKDGNMTAPYFTFVLPQTSVRQPLRQKFKPVKHRLYRVVANSLSDFSLYGDSHLEIKPLSGNKGYQRAKLEATR